MELERSQLRQLMDKTQEGLPRRPKKKAGNKKLDPDDIEIGDSVNVLSLGLEGTVNSLPNSKGEVDVQMGILNSWVNIKDLELLEKRSNASSSRHAEKGEIKKVKMSKALTIRPEINLIGKTVDEAIGELDKYLDDAFLANIDKVTIIHGRGTGALRNAIHTHLKKVKYVKSFYSAGYSEGNDGATIVEF